MNIKIKIKIIPTKQKPSFKILLSNSYDAFDSKNCLDLFCLSSSFFENNAPVLQNVAVFFNYQLTHKCGNRFGLISNRNIKKTTIKSLNNGKFRCISRFPISLHLPEVFEESTSCSLLSVVTAGETLEEPQALFQGTRMSSILEQLRTRHDLVLLDAPAPQR